VIGLPAASRFAFFDLFDVVWDLAFEVEPLLRNFNYNVKGQIPNRN
jgi:hypothetical protein